MLTDNRTAPTTAPVTWHRRCLRRPGLHHHSGLGNNSNRWSCFISTHQSMHWVWVSPLNPHRSLEVALGPSYRRDPMGPPLSVRERSFKPGSAESEPSQAVLTRACAVRLQRAACTPPSVSRSGTAGPAAPGCPDLLWLLPVPPLFPMVLRRLP